MYTIDFNANKVTSHVFEKFKSEDQFMQSCERLFISSEDAKKENAKTIGFCKPPVESTYEVDNATGEVRNQDKYTHSFRADSLEERKRVQIQTLNCLRQNGICGKDLCLARWEYDDADESEADSKKNGRAFRDTLFDFFDYIVPIISDDERTNLDIRFLFYANHFYELSGKMVVEAIFKCENPAQMAVLWSAFLDCCIDNTRKAKGMRV